MYKAGHGRSGQDSYSATRDNCKAKNLCAAALAPSAEQVGRRETPTKDSRKSVSAGFACPFE